MERYMKLWLDDVRPCPFIGNWLIAKNYEQAVIIMQENEIEEAWLDHDLAPEHYVDVVEDQQWTEKTGYDFVLWMKDNNKWPSKICMVHSLNPVGSKRMCEDIAQHYGTSSPLRHYMSYLKLESWFKGSVDKISHKESYADIRL